MTPKHVRAPLDTLPISQALMAIWETVPELDRPDDQADPLVPILQRLADDMRECYSLRMRAARFVRRCGLGPVANAIARVRP
jgi:hypothetical protein